MIVAIRVMGTPLLRLCAHHLRGVLGPLQLIARDPCQCDEGARATCDHATAREALEVFLPTLAEMDVELSRREVERCASARFSAGPGSSAPTTPRMPAVRPR